MKTVRYSLDFHPAAMLFAIVLLILSIWRDETKYAAAIVFILGIQIKREEW